MKPLIVALIAIWAYCASATEQMPDVILYEGQICELETSWEYPSPIEVYYRQSGKEYPSEAWHTANYRGHVATWALTNETLHLVEIKGETATLELAKIFPDAKDKDKIKASWFSGIAWVKTGRHKKEHEEGTYSIEYKTYVFIRFNQGKVQKTLTLTDKQYWKAVKEFFRRRETDNPVKEGPIFEYAQYISSFRKTEEPHNKPDAVDGK